MMVRTIIALPVALIVGAALTGAAAQAKGLGGEINYGKAEHIWGTEVGAGYAFDMAGFSLTPGAGLFFGGGDTKVYGRLEAAYSIPQSATIGIGVRIAGETRPYATVALPLLPTVAIKGNAGPDYYAIGLKIGY